MNPTTPSIRVIDVDDLEQDAIMVNIEGRRILLLDSGLDYDHKMEIMACFLGVDAA